MALQRFRRCETDTNAGAQSSGRRTEAAKSDSTGQVQGGVTESPEHYRHPEFHEKLRSLRRWYRWGPEDQIGAPNLITQSKVANAASLVTTGSVISMARPFPTAPSPINPNPAHFYIKRRSRGQGQASAIDYQGVSCHGKAVTHLDALAHVWDADGMWNGHDPDLGITYDGATWGGIENLARGIVTRGVLLDIARSRAEGYVSEEQPVTGAELSRLAAENSLNLSPGDALVLHSGRDAWERQHNRLWGAPRPDGTVSRPGLHISCLDFFHDADCSLIIWDMMDAIPNDYDVVHAVHAVIYSQGIPLLDNALLEPLAGACHASGRTDFLVCVAPLPVVGGTGSPVNPLAVF
jgi:kynurenine formamidase